MSLLRKKMLRDLSIRRFASTTKDSYLRAVSQLAKYYMIPPDQLTEEQLLDYINFLITGRKLSCGSVNVAAAGLRFFYKETLGRNEMALAIPPRKNQKKLPEIFNHDELKLLFASTENQKHRAMLMTLRLAINVVEQLQMQLFITIRLYFQNCVKNMRHKEIKKH